MEADGNDDQRCFEFKWQLHMDHFSVAKVRSCFCIFPPKLFLFLLPRNFSSVCDTSCKTPQLCVALVIRGRRITDRQDSVPQGSSFQNGARQNILKLYKALSFLRTSLSSLFWAFPFYSLNSNLYRSGCLTNDPTLTLFPSLFLKTQ